MGFFTPHSKLALHLAFPILHSGNRLPEFSCLYPFFSLIFLLLFFFCGQFLSTSFSTAQAHVPTKDLLSSKGSSCSATLSLKPIKHTLKVPQHPR